MPAHQRSIVSRYLWQGLRDQPARPTHPTIDVHRQEILMLRITRPWCAILVAVLVSLSVSVGAQTITTVAGGGVGDGALAMQGGLDTPSGA